jgi:Protein of unknown function (DUF3307)
MQLLTTLLLAHLFADFPLQTNGLAKLKKECLFGVFLHVFIYVIITALVIHEPGNYWLLILGLGVMHFLIDALKLYYRQIVETFYFVIDQCLHLLSLAIATYFTLHWYAEPPQSTLPYAVVLIALGGALILALMVFCWVWVNSLKEEQVQRHLILRWIKYQMLMLEQRIGLVLIGFVFAAPTYKWLTNIFHLVIP